MKDETKTKAQLILELRKLRRENRKIKEAGNGLDKIISERYENEKKFRLLYENMPIPYQSLNKTGNILEVNKAWCKVLGYKRDEVLGKNISRFLYDESKKKFKKVFADFLKRGIMHNVECNMLKKNNEIINVLCNGRVGYNVDGTIRQTHFILTDITEFKRADKMMEKQNIFLKNVFESIAHPLYVIDVKDYTIKMANSASQLSNSIGKSTCYSLTHKKNKPCNDNENPCPLELVKKTLKPVVVEHIHFMGDGSKINVEVHGFPIFDDKGHLTQMIEYAIDITEWKRFEEKLLSERDKFNSILQDLPIGVTVFDSEDKFVFINNTTMKIDGYKDDTDNLIGKEVRSIHPKDTIPTIDDLLNDFKSGKKSYASREAKRGKRSVEISYHAIRGTKGEYQGGIRLVSDITERKQAENLLRESEDKFAKAFKSSPNLLAITKPDNGEIVDVNEGFSKTLGYSRKELIGRSTLDINLWDNPELRSTLMKSLEENQPVQNVEINIRAKSGKLITELFSAEKIILNNEPHLITVGTNVTELKQAKESLHEEKEYYRKFVESLDDWVWEIDTKGYHTYSNLAVEKILGYKVDEVLGVNISELWCDETKTANNIEWLRMDIKSAKNWRNYETFLKHKNGSKVLIETTGIPIFDSKNNLIGYRGIGRDITERKKAEEELKEKAGLLRSILESIDNGILVIDNEGKVITSNKIFTKLWRIPEEILSTGDDEKLLEYVLYQLSDPKQFLDKVKDLYSKPESKSFDTLYFKDGRIFERYSRPLLIKEQIEGRIWSFRNVTERKKAEEELKISEERLALSLESAELGIWDQNMLTGEITRNKRWAEMLGYSLDEIAPDRKSWKDLIHPDDLQRVKTAIKNHEVGKTRSYKVEHRMRTKNGDWKWILNWGKIVERDKSGKPLRAAGTHLDITEMKKAEEKLRKYSENQAVLVREINHRVRNNLSAIIGMLYTEEELAKKNSRVECLPILRNLATRIKGLAIAHSMLSEGEWQPLKVTQLCENVINATVKSLYSSKLVNLLVSSSEVKVDSNQAHHLAMVINELTTNSLKYALQEKEKINIKINIKREGSKILIQFHDNGPGYPIELLEGDFSKASTGFEIINGIVKKSLFGEVELSNDNGAVTSIIFKNIVEQNKSES